MHEWAFKTLTIFDKVTVVKTVPLSVLVQCICVLHCPKPQDFKEIMTKLKRVKSSAYSFFCKSLLLTWINQCLDSHC